MANPGIIIPYLSEYFDVPNPKWVVGANLPSNILGLYDADTMTIYFRDRDPPIYVITHEFGHHLHNIYGIRGSRAEMENIANLVEKAMTEFYGAKPTVYSYTAYENNSWIFILIGLIILFSGFG